MIWPEGVETVKQFIAVNFCLIITIIFSPNPKAYIGITVNANVNKENISYTS